MHTCRSSLQSCHIGVAMRCVKLEAKVFKISVNSMPKKEFQQKLEQFHTILHTIALHTPACAEGQVLMEMLLECQNTAADATGAAKKMLHPSIAWTPHTEDGQRCKKEKPVSYVGLNSLFQNNELASVLKYALGAFESSVLPQVLRC